MDKIYINTAADLEKAFPELTAELKREACRKAEETKILSIVKSYFSPKAAADFEKIVKSGLTADKYKEMQSLIRDHRPSGKGAGPVGADPAAVDVFNKEVGRIMALEKCTRAKAISQIAAKNPKLHQAYIVASNHKRPRSSKPAKTPAEVAALKKFNQAVNDYAAQNNCSRGQAISHVASARPELHQAFIDAIQR